MVKFLRNAKDIDCQTIVTEMLENFKNLGCNMNL